MKKSVLSILFLAISLSNLVGCGARNTVINNEDKNIISNDVAKNNIDEEEIPVANMSGKLVNYYKTLEEINRDSEVIVKGSIIENEYIEYGGLVFTVSRFKVDDVVKGNVVKGDIIKVLQTGGISTLKSNEMDEKSFEDSKEVEKYLKNNLGKKYEATVEGVKVLKESDNAVVLLQKYDGPVTTDAYVGTGDFQGRFIINQKTKSINPQSDFLTETVTLDKLMNLK